MRRAQKGGLCRFAGHRMSSVLWLGRPTEGALAALLAEQVKASLTYEQVGATLTGVTPVGYRRVAAERVLGSGEPVFDAAVEGLRRWRAHRGAGLIVYPADVAVAEDTTVVLAAPVGPLTATACCRVVAVVDEPSRFGFAYGTLPAHPEQGEESFIVEHREDDAVVFCIVAFSRHRHPLARAAGPLTRSVQQRATRRYLQALQGWGDKLGELG